MLLEAQTSSATDSAESTLKPNEKILAGMVSNILGIERVGVTDNFFKLGGDSLQAMRLLAMIQDTLGVEIPPESVFLQPTVAQLASIVTQVLNSNSE
jgi:acyl carrier protein